MNRKIKEVLHIEKKQNSTLKPQTRIRNDLTGKRFGKLTVLEYIKIPNGTSKWKCQCDCGTITYKTTGHLNAGAVSCGCTKSQDLTGQRFGKLIVLEKTGQNRSRSTKWKCQCDCGNLCEKSTGDLNAGFATSCGCSWRQPTVREGDKFGRLTAIHPTEKRSARSIVWECQCDCGNRIEVRSTMLTSGHTTSCGCLKKEIDEGRDFKNILTYVDGTCIEFARDIGKPRSTTSTDTGVRGVVLKKDGKYQAHISFKKKRYYLGRFSRLEDAIRARKQAESQIEEYAESCIAGNPSSSKIIFN